MLKLVNQQELYGTFDTFKFGIPEPGDFSLLNSIYDLEPKYPDNQKCACHSSYQFVLAQYCKPLESTPPDLHVCLFEFPWIRPSLTPRYPFVLVESFNFLQKFNVSQLTVSSVYLMLISCFCASLPTWNWMVDCDYHTALSVADFRSTKLGSDIPLLQESVLSDLGENASEVTRYLILAFENSLQTGTRALCVVKRLSLALNCSCVSFLHNNNPSRREVAD